MAPPAGGEVDPLSRTTGSEFLRGKLLLVPSIMLRTALVAFRQPGRPLLLHVKFAAMRIIVSPMEIIGGRLHQ